MALRPTRQEDKERRDLLFGAQPRRPLPPGRNASSTVEQEEMETANNSNVDGLRGRVGEMRHVSTSPIFMRVQLKGLLAICQEIEFSDPPAI